MPEKCSPHDLPEPVSRLAKVLAEHGGLGATEIYGRLDLHRFGVKLGSFDKFARHFRRRGPFAARGAEAGRVDALADTILRFLEASGLDEAEARRVLERCTQLLDANTRPDCQEGDRVP